MNIPSKLTAGDSASWSDVSFSTPDGRAISAMDYTLSYSLRGPGAPVDLSSVANGSGWKTSLTTAQSTPLNPTAAAVTWFWQAYATKSGERVLAGEGSITIKPNLAALTGTFDGRSKAEQDLAAVKQEISNRISGGGTIEYSIGSRQLKKEPVSELLKLQDRLQMIVNRERTAQRVANGLGNPGKVMVRFK